VRYSPAGAGASINRKRQTTGYADELEQPLNRRRAWSDFQLGPSVLTTTFL
jgi:hypothetical protein